MRLRRLAVCRYSETSAMIEPVREGGEQLKCASRHQTERGLRDDVANSGSQQQQSG